MRLRGRFIGGFGVTIEGVGAEKRIETLRGVG